MNKKQEIETKLTVLREMYKTATEKERKLIVIRGKLYNRQLQSLQERQENKLI